MRVVELQPDLLDRAKTAFTTRRVKVQDMRTVIMQDIRPKGGDLVLATVDELGSHQRVELPNGRRARIFPGDVIIVCYGNRYAPDQFEAIVPEDLSGCELVAGGGIAGREICRHERMLAPTKIIPVGLVGDSDGNPLNIANYKIKIESSAPKIPVVLVFGTAMNSGKTMTAGSLVRGFATAGIKVAGIKATGTGSGGDLWFMTDMGAFHASDFVDVGLASTYLAPSDEIENGVFNLIDNAALSGCKVAVVEIADGLQHAETAALLHSERLRDRICGIVFAAYDALGADKGIQTLRANDHHVLGLSGQITRSPLAMREVTQTVNVPVFTPIELQSGMLNEAIMMGVDGSQKNIIRLQDKLKSVAPNATSWPVQDIKNGAGTVPAANQGVCGHEMFSHDFDEFDESELSDIADSKIVSNGMLPLRIHR